MDLLEVNLIQKIKNGDSKQFEQLFKSYYSLLCNYASQFLEQKEDAEEVVQELFFQLWKKRKELQIHTSFRAYLYRATYTGCMDKIRKEKVRNSYKEKQMKFQKNEYEEHALEASEIDQIILDTLSKLPENVKKVFKMSRFEGMKHREIAEQLSISVKTVEANMGKALKLFRNNLKDYVGLLLF